MKSPDAVKKYDGRVVAFDSARLAGSIMRAASAMGLEPARRLAAETAVAIVAQLTEEGRSSVDSSDIRAAIVKVLREKNVAAIADSYSEFGRLSSGLLWRIRVVQPGTAFTSNAGSPWDRRRLMESLRASGIARDPAGEAAREVERRVVELNQERISPALIHALAALVLSQRAMDVRAYTARRIAFSAAEHVPVFDAKSAPELALPPSGAALQAFWLQAVHSTEVSRAALENLLSLDPFPSRAQSESDALLCKDVADPLLPEFAACVRNWCAEPGRTLLVRADVPQRAAELSRYLSQLPAQVVPDEASGARIDVSLRPPGRADATVGKSRPQHASAVTINVAGLMVREALRDQHRATVRLVQMSALAAQAHREREEYFSLSPVRGRRLPVALAGLWNAAAWMQGEAFDSPGISRATQNVARTLAGIVRGALDTLRNETSMELCLCGEAPAAALRRLWMRDREFFKHDGMTLDSAGMYDGGPAVALLPGSQQLGDRLDFMRDIASSFDDPPAVVVHVPLGLEPDTAVWRELLAALAQAGVGCVRMLPGGSSRALRILTRQVRSHLEGFPLFDESVKV